MTVSFERCDSPNHDVRRPGASVDILLLHYTGMTSEKAALARLCDPEAKVSCHWMVAEDGRIVQLVGEHRRAWHAGVSCWAGESDVNSRSIGIEIVNPGHEFGYREFPDAQIAAVTALCREILSRHPIPPQRVLAHSDVAPARKADPGELFAWDVLAKSGIGHWVEPAPVADGPVLREGDVGPSVVAFQRGLGDYGYCLEAGGIFDSATVAVVTAFQRHFRPSRVDGVADPSTCATLEALRAGPAKL
jgi:N-acetylmuramoyl-L-alanine amidase